jgi:hypothetical protein
MYIYTAFGYRWVPAVPPVAYYPLVPVVYYYW